MHAPNLAFQFRETLHMEREGERERASAEHAKVYYTRAREPAFAEMETIQLLLFSSSSSCMQNLRHSFSFSPVSTYRI